MPGFTNARISSSTCRTMWPARRILSISDGDLQTIAILEHFQRLSRNRVHIPFAVYHMQPTRCTVIVGQWARQLLILFQPLCNHAFAVVLARDQLGAFHVAGVVIA